MTIRPHAPHATRAFALMALATAGCAHAGKAATPKGPVPPLERLTPAARADAIVRAQVWQKTDVASMDLLAGPQGPGSFAPGQEVACEYAADHPPEGHSPKFYCKLTKEDVVKVKFGADNGEAFGEVAATRLFWALGFGADRNYSVRVRCRGCSADPWHNPRTEPGERLIEPANVERKMPGATMESRPDEGWKWPELERVEEARGGAPRAHRDAFKLLAVMLQHTDSKAIQQRLMCLPDGVEKLPNGDERCTRPIMMVNDLGLTFGRASLLNLNSASSVNYKNWARTPVWKDPARCVGQLKKSFTGTLGSPVISEAGRRFLADLLVQLSDRQIRDLFTTARFELRVLHANEPRATVDDWAKAFKSKRDQIVNHHCSE